MRYHLGNSENLCWNFLYGPADAVVITPGTVEVCLVPHHHCLTVRPHWGVKTDLLAMWWVLVVAQGLQHRPGLLWLLPCYLWIISCQAQEYLSFYSWEILIFQLVMARFGRSVGISRVRVSIYLQSRRVSLVIGPIPTEQWIAIIVDWIIKIKLQSKTNWNLF